MPEYGFSSSDISSITSARAGLTAGFMQLGKQIQEDITRIATIREMKAFGQELAQIDPNSEAFPQQLIGTMSKYPLAIQTPMARQGIQVLGARYQAGIDAKQEAAKLLPYKIGDVTFDPRSKTEFRVDPNTGVTEFVDTTPNDGTPESGIRIEDETGQKIVGTRTGKTIAEFGPRPAYKPPVKEGAISEVFKAKIKVTEADLQIAFKEWTDLKKQESEATDPKPARERLKTLEARIDQLRSTRDQLIRDSQAEQSDQVGLPSGAGQGLSGPSLMPSPQSSFVPMGMPTNIAAPQMTLNTGENYIEPPTLPGVVPPAKQAGTPRAYQIQNGKFRVLGGNPRAAIEQAYADQSINEEQRTRYLGSLQ